MVVVAISGGFDPTHDGHYRYIEEALKLGDKLIIILTRDDQLIKKKGRVWIPYKNRKYMLEFLLKGKGKDFEVVPNIDKDITSMKSLIKYQPIHIFAKGGDTWDKTNLPEKEVCEAFGTEVIFGVGGFDKRRSSSDIKRWKKGDTITTIDVEEARRLRNKGYSLQTIGDRFGVSKQRVSQKLTKSFGTTKLCALAPRQVFAGLLGCNSSALVRLERQGLVRPLHLNGRYLYDTNTFEKVRFLISPLLVERVCEGCGKTFSRRPSYFKPTSPGKFCSNYCKGVYLGKHYGKNRK